MNDDLVGLDVVRRGRLDLCDVGTVADLRHGEAAHEAPRHDVGQVRREVTLGAEAGERAAEQAELDAEFDEERQVAEGLHLERDAGGAVVEGAAVLGGEADGAVAHVREGEYLTGDALALDVDRLARGARDGVGRQFAAHALAKVAPRAVERGAQDVDVGLCAERFGGVRVLVTGSGVVRGRAHVVLLRRAVA